MCSALSFESEATSAGTLFAMQFVFLESTVLGHASSKGCLVANRHAIEANWPKIKFHALREHAGLVFRKQLDG